MNRKIKAKETLLKTLSQRLRLFRGKFSNETGVRHERKRVKHEVQREVLSRRRRRRLFQYRKTIEMLKIQNKP